MKATDDMSLAQAGPAGAPPGDGADAALARAAVRAELPLTLLASGYHLRQINAVRVRFDGNPVRLVLPLMLWLSAQRADPRAAVAQAATVVLKSLGLETGPPRYSLREIETATGIARETLRRTARQLEDCGWIARAAAGEFAVTARFNDYLGADDQLEGLGDFRWTAARLRELSGPDTAGIGASLTEALAAMRACRSDELPASIHWALPAPPVAAQVRTAVVHCFGYNLRHLLRLARFFDGDLLLVVLLGELGHRNIAALAPGAARRGDDLATLLKTLSHPDENLLTDPRRGVNSYSLASCLGLPYETTRRKLARLCDRGFVTRDADGLYWVLPETGDHFRAFNREQRADMLATAATIEALLQTPAADQSVR